MTAQPSRSRSPVIEPARSRRAVSISVTQIVLAPLLIILLASGPLPGGASAALAATTAPQTPSLALLPAPGPASPAAVNNPIVTENQQPGTNAWLRGVYLGLRTNAPGFRNNTIFVVRDDRPAPFLYQQSINTDQAYNNYPSDGTTGKSLYTFNSFGANTISSQTRAVKVSFDRPYSQGGFDQVDEIEFLRWIERMGYDVTYQTDVDTHANPGGLRNHKAVLSVGHDEYWSKEMRDGFEGARDGGVNLAFFAADTSEVQVRYEASAAGVANRVIVCYKDASIDPVQGPTTTVQWRMAPVNRPRPPTT